LEIILVAGFFGMMVSASPAIAIASAGGKASCELAVMGAALL